MGSGFLVSAPLVASVTGLWAPVAMAALLVVAYGIGAMIRFNIRYAEDLSDQAPPSREHRLHRGHRDRTRRSWEPAERTVAVSAEKASHVILAGAYVISVSYYLQLLSAFVLDQLGVHDASWNRLGTTGALLVITAIGATWGLRALERVETYAVSLNLGTIAALLLALLVHLVLLASDGTLALPHLSRTGDTWHSIRVLMGLLIIVQGFETSRFLGAEHPATERARTMRTAQLISAVIYVSFVSLMIPLLHDGMRAQVTAVVWLVAPVTAILPTLIVVAAIGSQFSASVADDAGCAGLAGTIFRERLSPRLVYSIIGTLAIALTWLTDVLSIISIASRAFALFYVFQCAVTVATAYRRKDTPHRPFYLLAGSVLSLIAMAVTVFGVPAE